MNSCVHGKPTVLHVNSTDLSRSIAQRLKRSSKTRRKTRAFTLGVLHTPSPYTFIQLCGDAIEAWLDKPAVKTRRLRLEFATAPFRASLPCLKHSSYGQKPDRQDNNCVYC